jgi:hypothetical protein
MRFRVSAVLLSLLCAVTAFGQVAAPVIQNVSPSSGPIAGGTHITITGIELNPSCGAYMIACVPVVKIGGREAEIIERSSSRLVVIAPPGSHGRVDVEVTTPGGTSRLSRAFSYGATDFVRLLLPVFIEGEVSGDRGSRWATELRGFHRDNDAARVTGDPAANAGTISGRTAFTPPVSTSRQGAGRFLYVADEDLQAVVLNLRARDVSRDAENLGTEIPVVGLEQTFAGGADITLVNVPTEAGSRQKIRIYDFDGEYGRSVTVRVYADDGATLLASREIALSEGEVNSDYPAHPGQGEIDLNFISELAGAERVTVVIETPEEGRFWAFATVTNNETQLITTVTP